MANHRKNLFKRFWFTHGLSFIGGGAFIAILLFIFSSVDPRPNENAKAEVKKFRSAIAFRRGQGVFYDTGGLATYLRHFQDRIDETKNPAKPVDVSSPNSKYRWVIGFYWTMKNDKDGQKKGIKHDYSIIPTLVYNNGNYDTVFDYFEDADNSIEQQYYNHSNDGKKKTKDPLRQDYTNTSNAYDNGHLWP